jgi:hypothetical protein
VYKLPIYGVELVRERTLPAEARTIQQPAEAAAILHGYLAGVDREHFIPNLRKSGIDYPLRHT